MMLKSILTHDGHPRVAVKLSPFRLGLTTHQFGIIYRWRGLWRCVGGSLTRLKGAHLMACEDFPCCGHEAGDCEGQLYGSDEEIKQRVYDRLSDGDYDGGFEPEGFR